MIHRNSSINGAQDESSIISVFLQKLRCPSSFKPTHQALAAILKSCAAVSALKLGEALHGYVAKLGHLSCFSVSKAVLNMYAKCGALGDSQKLYDEMGHRDPVVWNILLSGFAGSSNYDAEAMRLFKEMHVCGEPKPNSITLAIILPVCARFRDVNAGKSVHSYAVKCGLEYQTLVGNALVSMYAKCSLVHPEAYAVFDGIGCKDIVSWNAIIAGFTENKYAGKALKLFHWMLKGPIEPNSATIANILPVCALLERNAACRFGKEIHCYALQRAELLADVSICNSFMSFYLRIGDLKEAEFLFRNMQSKDIISWNAIIAGYATNGLWQNALESFCEFLSLNLLKPDRVTLISILPACAHLSVLQVGKIIHGYTLRRSGLHEDTAINNALITFYAHCNDVNSALRTFILIPRKDLISWNAMLDALADGLHDIKFVDFLSCMLGEGVRPDAVTLLSVINVCTIGSRVDKIKEIHCFTIKAGFCLIDVEPPLGNAILDAYANCGNIDYAMRLFEGLLQKCNVQCDPIIPQYVNSDSCVDIKNLSGDIKEMDLSTWNLVIRIYAENNFFYQALGIFSELQARGWKPDAMTVVSIIPICAQMASSILLRQLHGFVVRACLKDLHLVGALIDGYSKCGTINCARMLFQSSPNKDLVMFTAMVSGYAMHGRAGDALRTYYGMLELGLKPDHVIFTAVLSACSHSGLVDEGWEIFDSIEKVHKIKPTMEQYSCVVDLLARGGRIKDAYSFVTRMPVEANANVWGTLLGACKTHHEVELGRSVANRLFDVEANNIGNYIVMSNLYAADAKWDRVMEIRMLMRTRDLKKPSGCSWIEVEGKNNIFIAGDSSHPQRSIVYNVLSILNQQISESFHL